MTSLPPPSVNQLYIEVSLLPSGHLFLSEIEIFGDPSGKNVLYPSMSFLLRHSLTKRLIVFDLGLRKDWENYTPAVVEDAKENFRPDVPVDVTDSLRRGGVQPEQVEFVVFSHIHFDHVGNPELFPSSTFCAGGGAEELLANGYTCTHEPKDQILHPTYAKDLLPSDRTIFFSDANTDWKPLGPFPRTFDFYRDGSVYIVDAPGHMPGHINLLVRTSADGAWLLLAGDSAHDGRVITGERKIGEYLDEKTGILYTMHQDMRVAQKHLDRIEELRKLPKVQVLISHEKHWYNENKDKGVVFPGTIPPVSS